MNLLKVLSPGWLTLIQDLGRQGVQILGMTPGGAADEHAFRWANQLLDNPQNAACIEILMGNFEAEFSANAQIAITGADQDATVNDNFLDPWSTCWVQAGDRIRFRRAKTGLRAYLSIQGGWQTPQCFGSRSVVVREGLGGLNGGPLQKNDKLPFKPQERLPVRQLDPQYWPDYQSTLTLKVIPGYQYEAFAPVQRQRLISGEYTVSQHIDRMGYQLTGSPIQPPSADIISEGIALGAIQIPKAGQPIVLLWDRQTIGGYPKLGCVTSLGCSRLAQRGPGCRVRFEYSDLATAQAERLIFNRTYLQAP